MNNFIVANKSLGRFWKSFGSIKLTSQMHALLKKHHLRFYELSTQLCMNLLWPMLVMKDPKRAICQWTVTHTHKQYAILSLAGSQNLCQPIITRGQHYIPRLTIITSWGHYHSARKPLRAQSVTGLPKTQTVDQRIWLSMCRDIGALDMQDQDDQVTSFWQAVISILPGPCFLWMSVQDQPWSTSYDRPSII